MDESDIVGTKLLKAQVIFRKVSKKISNDRQGLCINVRASKSTPEAARTIYL